MLTVDKSTTPKVKLPNEELLFGLSFTDHMLEIDWDNENGWHAPVIKPYGDMKISPAASALHYGLQAFEGMKAFKGDDGKTRLFRPMKNMERMNSSAETLFFPQFDGTEFLECIKELVRMDDDWIPKGNGYSLYIRPTIISTFPFLGVCAAANVKLFVILSPVGPYYPTGFNAVRLLADPKWVRAWPGGAGNTKVGGNYAPTIRVQSEAAKLGYQQIMWLFPADDGNGSIVTEVGTMNQFFFFEKADGSGRELVTAPLSRGDILPGVTRDTILQISRGFGEFEVSEREYTIEEIIAAIGDGRMLEAFGTGTAALVCPVKTIGFKGKDYEIPIGTPEDPNEQCAPLTKRLYHILMDIQYGRTPHEFAVEI